MLEAFRPPRADSGGDHAARRHRDCAGASGGYSARRLRFPPICSEGFMAATRFEVLGIGNAIVDVIARTDDDFLSRQKMRKGTMQLIDEAQASGIYDAMG